MSWLDLSHSFYEGMSTLKYLPQPCIRTIREVGRDPLNVMEYSFITHLGTHVDAPMHFIPGGETIDQLSPDRFTGAGAVIDLIRSRIGPITGADLEAAGRHVRRGDIVLVCTGWYEKFGTEAYELHPHFTDDAAEWFLEREVKFVGADTATPDTPVPLRPPGFDWPIHHRLLSKGVLIAENLTNLAPLAGKRATIIAAPIKLRGGDGGPARILATTEG